MDLGIKGKKALVCASSKGLGLGCARALAAVPDAGASAQGHGCAGGESVPPMDVRLARWPQAHAAG